MGCVMKNAKHATLYRMVMPEHVCPYGLKSKWLLESHGYQVDDHWLRTREETDVFKAEHNVATTPQTFIEGERVGGNDDLRAFFGKHVLGEKDASKLKEKSIRVEKLGDMLVLHNRQLPDNAVSFEQLFDEWVRFAKEQTGNERADHADHDIADKAETFALHDQAGKPTRDRPDDQG